MTWLNGLRDWIFPSSSETRYEAVLQTDDGSKKKFQSVKGEDSRSTTTLTDEDYSADSLSSASLPRNHVSQKSCLDRWKNFLLAWISITLAIIAGASIGPAFKYMSKQGIRSCLSASWRCQCMLIFLLPIAWLEIALDKRKKVDWFSNKPDLKYPVIVHVIFSGLAWSGNLLTWIVGLQYTSTFKASIIACSHPLMLALWLLIRGDKVSWFGLIGIFVAFGGLLISNVPDLLNDSATAEDGTKLTWIEQTIGIVLCLLAAACEVVVLFNRIVTQKYVPLMQYTFSTTIVVALSATLASIFLEGTGVIHSAALVDSYGRPIPQTIEVFCLADNCIFGWMAKKWALKMLLFGLIVGVVCIAGFNYAMQYLPPLVFSSTALLDPALTAILSWMAGIEHLPSLYSWLGGATVIVGVAVISMGEHSHSEDEATDHHSMSVSATDEEQDIGVGSASAKHSNIEMASSFAQAGNSSSSAAAGGAAFSIISEEEEDNDDYDDGAQHRVARQQQSVTSSLLSSAEQKHTDLDSLIKSQIAIDVAEDEFDDRTIQQLQSLTERFKKLRGATDVDGGFGGFDEEKPQN